MSTSQNQNWAFSGLDPLIILQPTKVNYLAKTIKIKLFQNISDVFQIKSWPLGHHRVLHSRNLQLLRDVQNNWIFFAGSFKKLVILRLTVCKDQSGRDFSYHWISLANTQIVLCLAVSDAYCNILFHFSCYSVS